MNRIFIMISMLFCITTSYAQQDGMFSQYMFNGLILNPAYAGSHDNISTSLLHRAQWTGFSGAPSTQTASIHAPIADTKTALGLIAMNDKIGISNQTDIYGFYAYRIPAGKGNLSLGVSAGLSHRSANLSKLNYWDSSDPLLQQGDISNTSPNFGTGIYYYTQKFYAGMSAPRLLETSPLTGGSSERGQIRHYYFTSGYVFTAGTIRIKPSVLIKYVKNAPPEADLNLNFLFQDVLWIGGSYRTGDGFVALAQYAVNRNMRIGYAFDIPTTGIMKYQNGTHEFFVSYEFETRHLKMKSPRYF